MFKLHFLLITLLLALTSCGGGGSSDSGSNDSSSDDTETDTGIDTETVGNFNSTYFSSDLTSEERVSCTLENGSTTTCYQLTFIANGAGSIVGDGTDGTIGPYCPESINTSRSEVGFGVYDGDTNPGFQSLVDAAINMDADGYDIVDEDGNIRSGGGGGGDFSYCLEMGLDDTIEIVYLIPVTPELRNTPYEVGTVESNGFGLNGVPYKGNPPSVTVVENGVGGTGSGNIPALDHCGGHPDPFGYYHWHFVPQSMNTVLGSDNFDFTEQHGITCSNSNIDSDDPSAFAGIAKDGFPIYAAYDSVDSVDTTPNDVAEVDECNGHSHTTDEFPDGVYHYHAQEDSAPNLPACLMGSFPNRDFTVN